MIKQIHKIIHFLQGWDLTWDPRWNPGGITNRRKWDPTLGSQEGLTGSCILFLHGLALRNTARNVTCEPSCYSRMVFLLVGLRATAQHQFYLFANLFIYLSIYLSVCHVTFDQLLSVRPPKFSSKMHRKPKNAPMMHMQKPTYLSNLMF